MSEVLRVQDIAKKYGISEHAVRYYTDLGLIPTVKRDSNNNRYFTSDSFEWFVRVIQLRKIGLSIKDVQEYVELCKKDEDTIAERREIILKQKEIALEKIKDIETSLEYLQHKLDYFEQKIKEKSQNK